MKVISTKLIFLICLFAVIFFLSVLIGADLSIGSKSMPEILYMIRLPRALTAVIAGCTFAMCGAVFQSLFRNPIASPFTLGTAGGASLGVTIYISFFTSSGFLGLALSPLFAFAGALLSISVIYFIVSIKKTFNPNTMILAGVVLNFFFSGMVLLIQYMTNQANAVRITRWTMGSLDASGFESLYIPSVVILTCSLIIYTYRDDLNLLSMGEDISASRGVDVIRSSRNLFLLSSIMVGTVVSITGPIGFIGIIAPHIAASFFGRNYRSLLPASAITGAILMLVCDFASRSLLWPVEVPVGIITAIIGAFFFMRLLK